MSLPPPTSAVGEPHLLVVDDDRRIRDLLSRFLTTEGYRISTAESAAEARAKLSGLSFDLIVLDLMMPGIDGVEVLKGPASLLYGQVMPGGLVSMSSKRPQSDAFATTALTVGSFGFREATFDINQPLSESGKAAFRVNGLVMNSDDPTDHVFFKSRFIAPTLSLDLGPRTDLTLVITRKSGEVVKVPMTCRLDTAEEVSVYDAGGVLHQRVAVFA